MLLVALASCTAVDVVKILEKKKFNLTFFEISVTAEQDQDPPWTFRKFHLLYKVKAEGLTEKALEQAIHLSETKYCSVAATIWGVAKFLLHMKFSK